MKKIAILLVLSLSVLVGVALAADGKTLYAKCAGCHGADGSKTTLGNTSLKGLPADTIAKALAGYKAKTFGGAKKSMMEGVSAQLSDADMKALAAYISKL